MKKLCVYHFPCPDGFSSAWVVNDAFFGEVDFIPMNYGDPVDMAIFDGRDVIMADFSFKAPQMIEACDRAKSVLVIDHHKTAQAELENLQHEKLVTIFDMKHSGAVLCWKHFFPLLKVPTLLQYIEDRDLWNWKLPDSREICLAISSYNYSFENWNMLQNIAEYDLQSLKKEGKTLKRQFDKNLDEMLKQQTTTWIDGNLVPVVNVPYIFASDAGNRMCKGHPFAASYYDGPTHRNWSLRSTDEGKDVSEVAKKFGGGGHRNAAGFRTEKGGIVPHASGPTIAVQQFG